MSHKEKEPQASQRETWLAGKTDPNAGEWEASAARGRALLDSESEAAELLGELDERIEARFAHQNVREPVKPQAKIKWLSMRQLALAAGLALFLTFTWLLAGQSSNVLDEHFAHYDYSGLVTTMGESTEEIDPDVRQALGLYRQREYEAASTALSTLSDEQRTAYELDFFLALSYLGSDQAELALPILKDEMDQNDEEATRFYYALALLANKKKDLARPILEQLASEKGLFAQRAAALVNP